MSHFCKIEPIIPYCLVARKPGFHPGDRVRLPTGMGAYDFVNVMYTITFLNFAVTRDRTRDLQIFSLTLSQLSYPSI